MQPRDTRWGGPGLDLDTARRGTAVRLVSRQNPVGSFSGIGPKPPDGIAVRRRVQEEMVRRLEGGIYRGYDDGRREAAISIGREGTCERDTEDLTTGCERRYATRGPVSKESPPSGPRKGNLAVHNGMLVGVSGHPAAVGKGVGSVRDARASVALIVALIIVSIRQCRENQGGCY